MATVLATMPAAVPVIWLGTKGTVWRSRGASTACRPPVSPGCAPLVAPNEANLLATQPVRRTSYVTGLYPTGGRHRNTAESFAPYREKVFEGLANTLGIAVGSSAAYDGDGKARGHDGPALTGLLLAAMRLEPPTAGVDQMEQSALFESPSAPDTDSDDSDDGDDSDDSDVAKRLHLDDLV